MNPDKTKQLVADRKWALWIALFVMAITMIPYLFGYMLTGAGREFGHFNWLGYNIDDSCVYLAWMRQVANGHFFQLNLFTTEAQHGHLFNFFFVFLGWVGGIFHLPLIGVLHATRLLLGVIFLRCFWWFLEILFDDSRLKKTIYLLLCFSSGLGWIPGLWHQSGLLSPVDVWQPEAITFLSLYLSPLFLISFILIIGIVGWMLIAQRDHSWRAALYAGICAFFLANVHTYDIITFSLVWALFLIVQSIVNKRWNWEYWWQTLLAGGIMGVSAGYMWYIYKTEPVFAKRVAVPTLSPSLSLYLLGYAPLIALSLVAIWKFMSDYRKRQPDSTPYAPWSSQDALIFGLVWIVANFGASYIPVPFQRKMMMGEHMPLCIFSGIALWRLYAKLDRKALNYVMTLTCLVLGLTNIRFMARDMMRFMTDTSQSTIQRPYMYKGEIAALKWIEKNTPAEAPIQPLPWITRLPNGRVAFYDTTLAVFAPGLTGHPVDAGHWGETPNFAKTMFQWVDFMNPHAPDSYRINLLRSSKIQYILFSQTHPERYPSDKQLLSLFTGKPPSYLQFIPAASNRDVYVYKVALP